VRDCVQFADESPAPTEDMMNELTYAPSVEGVLHDPAAARRIPGNILGGF
jgi:hypothetical protein